MTDLSARNIPFLWATTFFRQLVDSNLLHVIISPGSRSTPLTLAAAAHPHLQKHVILDERSAAFTALGIGKATGKPAVLVCTSGTAAANYLPAVIEARQSGVPMLLATADRPPHQRATGANQAIDQLKIFGDYPVFFHEVGEPHLDEKSLKRLKMLSRQSASLAEQKKGPVHLNFPFRKPLEPQPEFIKKIEKKNKKQRQLNFPSNFQDKFHLPEQVHAAVSKAQRPLLLVGPAAPGDHTESIAALAEQINSPVLTESALPSTNVIQGFAGFLRNRKVRKQLEPDLILHFGFQPTAKSIEQSLEKWQPKYHFQFASTHDWQNATFSESMHLPWLGRPFGSDAITSATKSSWLSTWKDVEQKFRSHLQNRLAEAERLTDGHVYCHLLPQCRPSDFAVVSNSFPARDIQLFGQNVLPHSLFLNRGVSGIDGVTSTAIGISLSLRKPGVLFTGDLAFLHDTNALLNHKKIEHSLTVIVINNSGGSIFRMLPLEEYTAYFEHYFETPQSVNIEQLVKGYDIPYQKIHSVKSMQNFDLQQWQKQHQGLTIIEFQTDADASMELRNKLWNF